MPVVGSNSPGRKTRRVLEGATKDLARYRSHLAYTRVLIQDSATQLEELREFIAEVDRRGHSLVGKRVHSEPVHSEPKATRKLTAG